MVLYFILFPIPLYKELVIIPVWHIESLENLSSDTVELDFPENELSENGQYIFNFKIGRMFGFIDLQGDLILLQQVDYNVALSKRSFINYSNLPNTFVVQDIEGEYVSSFWTSGYPKFSENGDRLFMIKNDSTGLSEINEEGDIVWSIEFSSLITNISITDNLVLIGLLDGRLKLIDPMGEQIFEVLPGGSRIQVIYGSCINNDGTVIAGISGINPQRFFYIKGPDFNNATVNFIDLKSDFRREVLISFSDSDKYIFFESPGSLGIFNLYDNKMNYIPIEGSLKSIREIESRGIISILSEYGDFTEFQVYRINDNLIYKEIIPYRNVFLKDIYESLIIGYYAKEGEGSYNTHLLRFDLIEM